MTTPIPHSLRAPVEQIFRGIIKASIFNQTRPGGEPKPTPPMPRIGSRRVLPPYLGEMGFEIRYHLAQVEPWLRNGWKIVAHRPEFYPPATTVDAPEFLAACGQAMAEYRAIGSMGGIYIFPMVFGEVQVTATFAAGTGEVVLKLDDVSKVTRQAEVEIALRQLFLEWFDYPGRRITNYDRGELSFNRTSFGNVDYNLAEALRPSYKPHAFENPIEPMEAHVGFQMRAVKNGVLQHRNSDPAWMCATARAIGEHLGLPVIAYGHPGGCVIPDDFATTWKPGREDGHLARELGYLKSCRIMLAPDSGWADLMAWLEIPIMLEMLFTANAFDTLKENFRPRMALVDRDAPIGPQVDDLLNGRNLLPLGEVSSQVGAKVLFPWDP